MPSHTIQLPYNLLNHKVLQETSEYNTRIDEYLHYSLYCFPNDPRISSGGDVFSWLNHSTCTIQHFTGHKLYVQYDSIDC